MKKRPVAKPIQFLKGGWSDWMSKKCQSKCLLDGQGYQKRERKCNNPIPINTDEGCPGTFCTKFSFNFVVGYLLEYDILGPSYSFALCSDKEVVWLLIKKKTTFNSITFLDLCG